MTKIPANPAFLFLRIHPPFLASLSPYPSPCHSLLYRPPTSAHAKSSFFGSAPSSSSQRQPCVHHFLAPDHTQPTLKKSSNTGSKRDFASDKGTIQNSSNDIATNTTTSKESSSSSSSSSSTAATITTKDNVPVSSYPSSAIQSISSSSDGVIHVSPQGDVSLMDSITARRSRTRKEPLTIVVLGASGDLAKKKTFPALFSLYYHELLPANFQIIGFARSSMSQQQFHNMITSSLTCRVIDGEKCQQKMNEFLPKCRYMAGQYDNDASFYELADRIKVDFEMKLPKESIADRLFYLAVPPNVFETSIDRINRCARATRGWTRVVVEKPFGRDAESYAKLRQNVAASLLEEETYRIDHYLGKELVQNLMTLRFANAIFEPIWNRNYIESVQITFKEPFGVEGRAGYFDKNGIIRDIMQNHLLQVLSLVAMENPLSLHAEDIRNEKVKLLKSIHKLTPDDFVIAQYVAGKTKHENYLDGEGVNPKSRTPTFAACVFNINNRRWDGVPFLMKAGKALDERKAEIRVRFKDVPGNIFGSRSLKKNELVIRVQPDEAIYLKIVSKVPGLSSRLEEARLNMFYKTAWEESKDIPDAYERLILDVIQGEKSLFIRDDELQVAWDIFSDAIKAMEADHQYKPETYEYGSLGPLEAEYLAAKHNVKWSSDE